MDWIDKFTEMIFPLDREHLDIEGAFSLKDKHIPSSIFKYREINKNSLKNLEEDTIWLADPSNFNDPYDCSHTVDYQHIQKQKSSAYVKKYLANNGKLLITDSQKNKILSSSEPMNDLIDIMLLSFPSEQRESMKSILVEAQNKAYEEMTIAGSNHIAGFFKVCSFSEINNSMLLWAHYTNYHQGFCVEYDLESIVGSDFRRRFLYPSIYSNKMFNATEHILKGVDNDTFNNLHLSLAALIKAKDWEYEKEWRLVFANNMLEKEQSYKIGKPKKVYFGTKIKPDDEEKLIEICERKGIPFCKMKANQNEFKLEPIST